MGKTAIERLLDMVPASMEERDAAADKFCGIVPICEPSRLKRLTDEGYLTASVIQLKGVAQYVVWHSPTIDGGLHVNACIQVVDNPVGFPSLISMLESLAEQSGLTYIRWNTARPGLIAKGAELGFKAIAVCMVKHL